VLKAMRFNPSGHNSIYTDHLETITDTLEEICPIDAKKCISILGASVGLSDKFVKEHIRRLEACEVIKREKGVYIWNIGVKKEPKSFLIEGMKNEDVPDTAPGNIGIEEIEIRPCTQRNDKMICSVIKGHSRQVTSTQCNACGSRQEA